MISKALEKLAQKYGLSFREVMSMSGVYIIYFPDLSIFGVLVRYDRDNERLSYSDDSYNIAYNRLAFSENKSIRGCLESLKKIEKTIKANIKIAKEFKVKYKIHQIEKDFK